jgi:ABC-type branched-subunit amino acid transport system ATPase component
MLRVTNLFAGYGKTDVLHGVSFEVKAGQCAPRGDKCLAECPC